MTRKRMLGGALALAALVWTLPLRAVIPASERQALLDLYSSTNLAGWTTSTGWNGAAGTECTWYGVTCSGNTVTQLHLSSNGLTGSLPVTLGNLTGLQFLDLSDNYLMGSIPSFASSPALWWVSFMFNQLTGGVPSFASNTALQDLYLTGNQLTGSIPSFASNTALQTLELAYNQLSGSIPSFASNTVLSYLDLRHNQLSGSIPSFASNTALQALLLSTNQLTGSIPPLTSNTALISLDLYENHLTGSIPSLASNTGLKYLHLYSNQLAGPIDASLGTLTNLLQFDIRWNALSSTDPTLIAFLNSKQEGGDWQSTQTIPVTGLSVTGVHATYATVNWTPITYAGDTGNYQVFYSTVTGGPYTPFATVTANKSAASLTVTGLAPLTPYYFVVQTTTNPHGNNSNTVSSGYSAEVPSATTPVELLRFGGE